MIRSGFLKVGGKGTHLNAKSPWMIRQRAPSSSSHFKIFSATLSLIFNIYSDSVRHCSLWLYSNFKHSQQGIKSLVAIKLVYYYYFSFALCKDLSRQTFPVFLQRYLEFADCFQQKFENENQRVLLKMMIKYTVAKSFFHLYCT